MIGIQHKNPMILVVEDMNKIGSVVFCFLIVSSMLIFPIQSDASQQDEIIYVDDDNIEGPWDGSFEHPFQYIQEGINASMDGDTVFVHEGTYTEHLIVDTSIKLIGENKEKTHIIDDFSLSSATIVINKNDVTLTNFSIIGEAVSSGININSDYSKVSDNIIRSSNGIGIYGRNNFILRNWIEADSFWGIELKGASSGNEISNNSIKAEDASSGIYLIQNCRNNQILGNTISSTDSGIRLFMSNKNTIANNEMSQGGLRLQYSHDNVVYNNTVNEKSIVYLDNESDYVLDGNFGQIILINCTNITIKNQSFFDLITSIYLYHSENCKITNNIITHHNPFRATGIYLLCCENITIVNNTLTYVDAIELIDSYNTLVSYNSVINCRTGLFLSHCTNTQILSNNFVNNSLCVDFYYISTNSLVSMNNFVGRWPQALFCDPLYANNTWIHNYWSRPRILPKIIPGKLILKNESPYPTLMGWVKFDMHPAKEPYDIDGGGYE